MVRKTGSLAVVSNLEPVLINFAPFQQWIIAHPYTSVVRLTLYVNAHYFV